MIYTTVCTNDGNPCHMKGNIQKECPYALEKRHINIAIELNLYVPTTASNEEIDRIIKKKISDRDLNISEIEDYAWCDADDEDHCLYGSIY